MEPSVGGGEQRAEGRAFPPPPPPIHTYFSISLLFSLNQEAVTCSLSSIVDQHCKTSPPSVQTSKCVSTLSQHQRSLLTLSRKHTEKVIPYFCASLLDEPCHLPLTCITFYNSTQRGRKRKKENLVSGPRVNTRPNPRKRFLLMSKWRSAYFLDDGITLEPCAFFRPTNCYSTWTVLLKSKCLKLSKYWIWFHDRTCLFGEEVSFLSRGVGAWVFLSFCRPKKWAQMENKVTWVGLDNSGQSWE